MKELDQCLTQNTLEVFEKVSKLECIRDLYLCGGTAQALLMAHRKSEDLDFELLGIQKERPGLSFDKIINEVQSIFPNARKEILGNDHFQMFVGNNVKLSFFRPQNNVPKLSVAEQYNNIKIPSLKELFGMKVFTTKVRYKFRDYYDIYCLLKEGLCLKEAVDYACKFSKYTIRSKQFYSELLVPSLFAHDTGFELLDSKYKVTPEEIKDFIQEKIIEEESLVNSQKKEKISQIYKELKSAENADLKNGQSLS